MSEKNLTVQESHTPVPYRPISTGSLFVDIRAFEDAQRIASMLSRSDIVPTMYQGNVANCMIALELSLRLQTSPFIVMQNVYVVHGRPAFQAVFYIGTINSCGRFSQLRYEETADSCRAWANDRKTGERLDGPLVTMAMAKAEGWTAPKRSMASKWATMPELMLRYRAAAFFGRTYCPELLMGMHMEDEIEDSKPQAVNEVSDLNEEFNDEKPPNTPKRPGAEGRTPPAADKPKGPVGDTPGEAPADSDNKVDNKQAPRENPAVKEDETSDEEQAPSGADQDPGNTDGADNRRPEKVKEIIVALAEITNLAHLKNYKKKNLGLLIDEQLPNEEDQAEVRRFAASHQGQLTKRFKKEQEERALKEEKAEAEAEAKARVEERIRESSQPKSGLLTQEEIEELTNRRVEREEPPLPEEPGDLRLEKKYPYFDFLGKDDNPVSDPAVPGGRFQIDLRRTVGSDAINKWRYANFTKVARELNLTEQEAFNKWVDALYNYRKDLESQGPSNG